ADLVIRKAPVRWLSVTFRQSSSDSSEIGPLPGPDIPELLTSRSRLSQPSSSKAPATDVSSPTSQWIWRVPSGPCSRSKDATAKPAWPRALHNPVPMRPAPPVTIALFIGPEIGAAPLLSIRRLRIVGARCRMAAAHATLQADQRPTLERG